MYRAVRKNLLVVPGSPVTLIVRCDSSNWLVDPGMGSDRFNILADVLSKINMYEYDILVSHTHYDHIEVLPYFRGKRIYVNESEYSQLISPLVREHATYGFNPLPRLMGLQRLVVPSEDVSTFSLRVISRLDCLELLDLSGHSPGLTGFIVDDVVFVGDSLFGDALLKRVGIPYHADVFKSLKVLNEVLGKLSDKGFDAVLSHGPVVKSLKFKELVSLNIQRLEYIMKLLNDELSVGGSIEELAVRVLKKLEVDVSASNVYLSCATISSIISKLYEDRVVEHVISDEGVKWRLVRH
ncbi:MAG: MBL fold metallo-hydrolase [Sulfolobales archaeon]